MNIDLRELIQFMDEQGTRPRGHTTKFIAVAGEEFVTALFLDYLRRCEDKSGEVLIDSEGIPRTPMADLSTREGHKGRPRELDRWISINRGETFIQAEVKSSCAGALGIRSLELRRNPEEVRKFAKNQYEQYFGAQSWFWQDRGWRKLLLKMQQPDECRPEIVRAALLLWVPTSPCIDTAARFGECCCEIETPPSCEDHDYYYTFFRVFSASLYCRQLLDDGLTNRELSLPLLDEFYLRLGRMGFVPKDWPERGSRIGCPGTPA